MTALLDDAFAPITTSIGFLKAPLAVASEALIAWRKRLWGEAMVTHEVLRGELPALLHRLEPLTTGGRPRELLIECPSGWTAYVNCGVTGSDPEPVVSYLSRQINCLGLVVTSEPDTITSGAENPGRWGAVTFVLLGPGGEPPMGYLRWVGVVNDGGRWEFEASGQEQPYEDPARYRARRKKDRFTNDMLADYCAAIGINLFDAAFYGPEAAMVRTPFQAPVEHPNLTLKQVRTMLGIPSDR